MIANILRVLANSSLTLIAAGALGACSSFPGAGSLGGGGDNFAAGQEISARLTSSDRDALSTAFIAAMDSGAAQNWRGNRAAGAVTPGGYAIAGLLPDPDARMDAARGDLDVNVMVETDLGLHVLTRNSNIRTAPDAQARIAEVLPSGSGVEVVGGVRGKNWKLVAVKEDVRGYVFGDLLIKAPGSELELAGGPVRKPVMCRKFRQRINSGSERAEWDGAACNDGTGWRLAREPAPDEHAPELLLEY